MPRALVLLLLGVAEEETWRLVDVRDGVRLEARAVQGSPFAELRTTAVSPKRADALCDEAWGDGKFDPTEPDLALRRVLSDGPTERVVYEQLRPSLVSPRDYVLRFRRSGDDAGCQVTYETDEALAPPLPDGMVRIRRMWGRWQFAPTDGGTAVTWVSYADPAGALPPFLVEGGRRTEARARTLLLMQRAK